MQVEAEEVKSFSVDIFTWNYIDNSAEVAEVEVEKKLVTMRQEA
jgi:hypothetical protein